MKKIIRFGWVVLLIILMIVQDIVAQPTTKDTPMPTMQDFTSEQFLEELFPALYANDEKRIQQLVAKNPLATVQVYQALVELGKRHNQDAALYRHLASLLEPFLPENTIAQAKELSKQIEGWEQVEDFWEELWTAIKSHDIERAQQLIIANPDATEQVQRMLEESAAATDTGEEAQQARTFAETFRKFRSSILDQLYKEGQQAYDAVDYQTALKKWQQGLKQAQILKEQLYTGMFLTSIRIVYEKLGKYQQALESYQEALTIHQEIGNHRMEGIVLNGIGAVYMELEQYQQALDYHKQALLIQHKLGDQHGEGATLEIIAVAYEKMGQYNDALEYYEKALTINRGFGYHQFEGDILIKLGNVYQKMRQYQQALANYEQALTMKRKLNDRHGEADVLTELGTMYSIMEEHQQALGYYKQALTIFQEIDDESGEGDIRNNIGMAHKELGQYQEALTQLKQALAIQRKLDDVEGNGMPWATSATCPVLWDNTKRL